MKNKILLTTVFFYVFWASFSYAQATAQQACASKHKLATAVMDNRQNGHSMPEMMRLADGEPTVEDVVKAAYEEPRYSTSKMKKETIEDFANEVYKKCLHELGGA